MSSKTPVAILTVLGAVIAVLGLFVAGNIAMVGIGLVAVFGASLLDVIAIRRVQPSAALAVVGILLIVFAIPFGLMLAPLAIGVIVLVVGLRRLDRAVNVSLTGGIMSDLLVLVVVVGLPAVVVIGPLAVMALGLAAVADLAGNGLVRPSVLQPGGSQPAPGSSSMAAPADGSLTNGPASRISSVTPSA